MCEKSWMCMWRWAHRHMSQDDFVYVFLCVWRHVYEQRQPKQTVSADNGQQMTVNLLIHESLQRWIVLMCCAHITACEQTFILHFLFLPLLCPSVRTCHCHPARPGRQHPRLVIPPPTGLHGSQEASLQPETCTGVLPVPSASADHATFISRLTYVFFCLLF